MVQDACDESSNIILDVSIPINRGKNETIPSTSAISASLTIPNRADGLIIFVRGSGNNRHSRRNKYIGNIFNKQNFATLLVDLLSSEEYRFDNQTNRYRFDIGFQSIRLLDWIQFVINDQKTSNLKLGLFGTSTGAAVALLAASYRPKLVHAIVSRGGALDLITEFSLKKVTSPTLLIISEWDKQIFQANERALKALQGTEEKNLRKVAGATHLFEEPGALEEVAAAALEWFKQYLRVTALD
jgi:putative phosphoribosyl transferase